MNILNLNDLEFVKRASSGGSGASLMRLMQGNKETLYYVKGLLYNDANKSFIMSRSHEISEYLGSSIAHQLLGDNAAETTILYDINGNLFLGSKVIAGYYNKADNNCYHIDGEVHRSVVMDLINYVDGNGYNTGSRIDEQGNRHAALIDFDTSMYSLDRPLWHVRYESTAEIITAVESVLAKKAGVLNTLAEGLKLFGMLYEQHNSKCDISDFSIAPSFHYSYLGEHSTINDKWWYSSSFQRADIYLQNCTSSCDGDFKLGFAEAKTRIIEGISQQFGYLENGLLLLKTNAALAEGDISTATALFDELSINELQHLWPAQLLSLLHLSTVQHADTIAESMREFFDYNPQIAREAIRSCYHLDGMAKDNNEYCKNIWEQENIQPFNYYPICQDLEAYKAELLPILGADGIADH